MTQMPMNIFDLLMGDLGNIAVGPAGGKQGGTDVIDGLFEALINSCMASGTNEINGNPLTFPGADTPVARQVAIKSVVTGDEAGGKIDYNWPGAAADSAAEFSRQLLAILPRQSGVIRANVKDVLNSHLNRLEPGIYEVLSSRVQNGSVTLEVAAKDAPGKAIRITIPTDVFNGSINTQMGGPSTPRVSLGTETYQLDNILSQLNLKEIRVDASTKSEMTAQTVEPVKITLVAETTAGEQFLRVKLSRNQVKVSEADLSRWTDGSKSTTGRPITSGPVTGAAKVYTPLGIYNNSAGTTGRQAVSLPGVKADPWSSFSQAAVELESTDRARSLEELFGYETRSSDNKSAVNKTEGENIRLMLPNDLATNLRVNGRAVTIRIEPEHLGPARLSLSMVDDKLKARIVVESAPAKLALEQNLDSLLQELNKAGIEVDNIEITINNGDAHNQMLGRQPHWRHRVATRLPRLDGDVLDPAEVPIIPPPAASSGYAGPAGVNLLA